MPQAAFRTTFKYLQRLVFIPVCNGGLTWTNSPKAACASIHGNCDASSFVKPFRICRRKLGLQEHKNKNLSCVALNFPCQVSWALGIPLLVLQKSDLKQSEGGSLLHYSSRLFFKGIYVKRYVCFQGSDPFLIPKKERKGIIAGLSHSTSCCQGLQHQVSGSSKGAQCLSCLSSYKLSFIHSCLKAFTKKGLALAPFITRKKSIGREYTFHLIRFLH